MNLNFVRMVNGYRAAEASGSQHKNAVETIREVMNFLLLRGNVGRPGAGPCPARGHVRRRAPGAGLPGGRVPHPGRLRRRLLPRGERPGPLDSTAEVSNTPTSKSVIIHLDRPAASAAEKTE
jgi:anaerobic selenocysteine-containing dehydrogenase